MSIYITTDNKIVWSIGWFDSWLLSLVTFKLDSAKQRESERGGEGNIEKVKPNVKYGANLREARCAHT